MSDDKLHKNVKWQSETCTRTFLSWDVDAANRVAEGGATLQR